MLQQQMSVYEHILKDLSATARDTIITASKDINRAFTPVVEQAMQEAYDACVAERGTGSFARMKAAMNSHVAHTRHSMFQESASQVKRLLEDLAKQVEKMMSEKTDDVFVQMQRDYRSVLGGGDNNRDGEILPRIQRVVRKEILAVIEAAETRFRKAVGFESGDQEGEPDTAIPDEQQQQSPGRFVKEKLEPSTLVANNTESLKEEPMDDAASSTAPDGDDDMDAEIGDEKDVHDGTGSDADTPETS